jgi:TonB family protein
MPREVSNGRVYRGRQSLRTTFACFLLAVAAAAQTAVDRDKWPEQRERIDKTQWPVLFSGPIEKSVAVCLEVLPKIPDEEYVAAYTLSVFPDVQFRFLVDDQQKFLADKPVRGTSGSFSLKAGRHTFEIVVRAPTVLGRMAMILRMKDEAELLYALRLCEANAPLPLEPKGSGIVQQPMPIYRPEPEMSDVARQQKASGSVMLAVVIGVDGKAHDINVVRAMGLGLDEKAIEAVSKWTFKPATVDGKPVPFKTYIETNFR